MPAHHLLRSATRFVTATATLALAGACSASSSHRTPTSSESATTVTSVTVTAPANEKALARAARAMASAPSFRFSADITRSSGPPVHLAGEFSAPDHLHQIISAGGQPPVEVVFIGGHGYRKRADGHWVQGTAPGSSGGPTDPGTAFKVVAGASSTSADGAVYHFTLTGKEAHRLDGAATKVEGTATVAGDTITALSYQGDDPGRTTVAVRYSDIGSTPPVTAPKLG